MDRRGFEPCMIISIHAPAKGATIYTVYKCILNIFQSTLPRRERLIRKIKCCSQKNFNPRSREGSDKLRSNLFVLNFYFNPRSREGSDEEYQNLVEQM